ncbi:MAG TPA: hypothetical protein VKY89_19140, partial [Thermoanaerobaculia bacterium]|nr:hypothetical protein [Thermoanaerobaculia bacterium]
MVAFRLERVVAFRRNQWSPSIGISGRLRAENAFHIDLCPPRAPEAKGKIERRIRDHRVWLDPGFREWDSLEELQEWSDR